MAETTVLEIDFGSTLENIVNIKKSIAELKKEREDLTKAINDGIVSQEQSAKAMTLLDAGIRSQTKELTTLNRVIDNEIKIRKSETGSIEANRAELSRLTAEYIKLGKPTEEQTKRIKDLSDKLKQQEAAIGNTSRNVGNYQKAFEGALKNVRLFGVSVGDTVENLKKKRQEMAVVANSIGTVDFSLKGLTNGLKIFKVALLATGIGAFILALTSLAGLFAKSETGIELINKAMNIFGATVDVVIKRVEQFAKGVSFILDGQFNKGVETLSGSFKGLGQEISNAAAAAKVLSDAQEALEDAEIGFIERRSQIRAQIQDLRDIANDETKAYEERKRALQEALILQAELTGKEAEIAESRLDVAEKEFALSAKTDEDRKKFEEAKAAAFEDERDRTKEKIKLENELNTLNKQASSEQKKLREEAGAEEKKRLEDEEKARKKRLSDQLKDNEQYFAEQELIEKENFASGVINREEYNRRIAELKVEEAEATIEILETFGQEVADKQIELDNLVADNKIAIREKDIENQIETQERIKELNEELIDAESQVQQAKIDLAQASFNIIEEFAKEESVLGRLAFLGTKAAALADVIVQAQKGFAAIAANLAAIPPILPPAIPNPAYPIAVGLALKEKIALGIQTGIAAATIGAQTVKGFFAEGGEVINVGGRPHAQGGTTYIGEDGNAFEVERGEKVFVLKKTASDLINKYSMINQMAGGKSWRGGSVRHAALGGEVATSFDGGFVARNSLSNVQQQIAADNLATMLRNMPAPVVRVTEINKVQGSLQQAVEVSDL